MYTVKVLNDNKRVIESRRFRNFNKMRDYASDVVGTVFDATTIVVDGNDEHAVIDCWQLRDKAIVDGYELPVHRKMLAHS